MRIYVDILSAGTLGSVLPILSPRPWTRGHSRHIFSKCRLVSISKCESIYSAFVRLLSLHASLEDNTTLARIECLKRSESGDVRAGEHPNGAKHGEAA